MNEAWTSALRSLAANKAIKQLLAEVERCGNWVGRLTGTSHIMLRHRRSGQTVVIPATPGSKRRGVENARASIRRAERAAGDNGKECEK
jgi:predicted RNA binding protein YcfA (HicA-like mRNA interferase family)